MHSALIVVLLFAQQVPPSKVAPLGPQVEVRLHGTKYAPKSGTFTVKLTDAEHPLGYSDKPKCWAKQIGNKQNAFTIDNTVDSFTVKNALSGSLVEWECHGFMYKNNWETCMDSAAKHKDQAEAERCGPTPAKEN